MARLSCGFGVPGSEGFSSLMGSFGPGTVLLKASPLPTCSRPLPAASQDGTLRPGSQVTSPQAWGCPEFTCVGWGACSLGSEGLVGRASDVNMVYRGELASGVEKRG